MLVYKNNALLYTNNKLEKKEIGEIPLKNIKIPRNKSKKMNDLHSVNIKYSNKRN